jgi:ATP-dependent HslUV protease subunit HslV
LLDTDADAESIARKAMQIAADICVYTNHNIVVETLDAA